MSLHPSLKVDSAGAQQRTVLSRIERIKDLMKKIASHMNEGIPLVQRQYGTSGGFEFCEAIGNIPVKKIPKYPKTESDRGTGHKWIFADKLAPLPEVE